MDSLPGFFPGQNAAVEPGNIARKPCSAYSIRQRLQAVEAVSFCPFCEMDESYETDTGAFPYIELRKYCDDLLAENRHAPHDFSKFVGDYYEKYIRKTIVRCRRTRGPVHPNGDVFVTYPKWDYLAVLDHFIEHETCDILLQRVTRLQCEAWKQSLADTSSYEDGPPDLNNIKIFLLLTQTVTNLAGPARTKPERPRGKPY